MLMFFNISQNSGLFTKLIKTAEGFFEGLVVTYSNASQLLNTPFTDFSILNVDNISHISV